jgi:hypothetical protein
MVSAFELALSRRGRNDELHALQWLQAAIA